MKSIKDLTIKPVLNFTIEELSSQNLISQVNFREKFIKIESREATRYTKSWKLKTISGHNIGSHALRRTFASYLMNQTFEPLQIGEISKVLGHKNIKTTMIYLYDIVDLSGFVKMRKAISKMNY